VAQQKLDEVGGAEGGGEVRDIGNELQKPVVNLMGDQHNELHEVLVVVEHSKSEHQTEGRVGHHVNVLAYCCPVLLSKVAPTAHYAIISSAVRVEHSESCEDDRSEQLIEPDEQCQDCREGNSHLLPHPHPINYYIPV
jgi:hypothetical protein